MALSYSNQIVFYKTYHELQTLFPTDIPAWLTVRADRDMMHYFDVENLLPYNSYKFRVRAVNEKGVGPPSKATG